MDWSRFKWLFLGFFTVFGIAADQISKYCAVKYLVLYKEVPVVGSWIQWQLVYNKGALFGLNPRNYFSWFPVNLFFIIFSIIAVGLLIYYFVGVTRKMVLTMVGISLIMPGAWGNFLDRIVRSGQGVVDFIRMDFNFRPFDPWPIYNVADVFITVGIFLILLDNIVNGNDASRVDGTQNQAE